MVCLPNLAPARVIGRIVAVRRLAAQDTARTKGFQETLGSRG